MLDTKNFKQSVSVVVCAYNEQRTVGDVIDRVLSLEFVNELVVVNNGSTDQTGEIVAQRAAASPKVKVITIQKNKGLGHGLMAGIRATTGEIVVRQDADLEYDPAEIRELIQPIAENKGNVSFGSRMLVRKAHRCNYYYNYLANVFFTTLVNTLVNINFTDVETGSKAFDGKLIRSIDIKSSGFEVEIEMLFKLRRAGATFYEVPVSYYGRTLEEGKKIRFIDAIWTLLAIFKHSIFGKRSTPTLESAGSQRDLLTES